MVGRWGLLPGRGGGGPAAGLAAAPDSAPTAGEGALGTRRADPQGRERHGADAALCGHRAPRGFAFGWDVHVAGWGSRGRVRGCSLLPRLRARRCRLGCGSRGRPESLFPGGAKRDFAVATVSWRERKLVRVLSSKGNLCVVTAFYVNPAFYKLKMLVRDAFGDALSCTHSSMSLD